MYMKYNQEKIKTLIGAILCVPFIILYVKYVGCPIKMFTGISCPGCGMTRAWVALFRLNIEKAWYFHPLFIVPFIVLVVHLFKDHMSTKTYNVFIDLVAILFIAVYVYRMYKGTYEAVVFEPKNGLFMKCLEQILGGV